LFINLSLFGDSHKQFAQFAQTKSQMSAEKSVFYGLPEKSNPYYWQIYIQKVATLRSHCIDRYVDMIPGQELQKWFVAQYDIFIIKDENICLFKKLLGSFNLLSLNPRFTSNMFTASLAKKQWKLAKLLVSHEQFDPEFVGEKIGETITMSLEDFDHTDLEQYKQITTISNVRLQASIDALKRKQIGWHKPGFSLDGEYHDENINDEYRKDADKYSTFDDNLSGDDSDRRGRYYTAADVRRWKAMELAKEKYPFGLPDESAPTFPGANSSDESFSPIWNPEAENSLFESRSFDSLLNLESIDA
jgi:hypothetical protein